MHWGEKWESSKGGRGLLVDGLGGVRREDNLGGSGFGIFGAVWCLVYRGWGVVLLSACVLL